VSIDWSRLVTGWQTDDLAVAGMLLEVVTAAVYCYGVSLVRRRGRRWPFPRTACFVLGLLALAVVLQSGFARYDDLLWVHMVQHLVIMMLAAPLLALGAPVRLTLSAGSPAVRRCVARVLHDPCLRLAQGRSASILLPLDYFGSMALLLLTPLYRLSELNSGFHEFVHGYFLVCGLMFWVPLLGVDPAPWRPSYSLKLTIVSLGIPVCTAISVLMVAEGRWLSPAHTVADIDRGAIAMLTGGILLTAGAMLLVFRRERQVRGSRRATVRPDPPPDSRRIAGTPPAVERLPGLTAMHSR
jgi:cytochrome c oxidase assembly factor CtaG